MGYTSYWKRPEKLDEKKFEQFVEECKLLHKNLPKTSETAGGYYKDDEIIICGGNGEGEPIFDKDLVCFNGSEENDMCHETLYIERVKKDDFFDFCKTARKPYDFFVCACLISFKKIFGSKVDVSSDGGVDDWKPAMEFYEKTTGKKVPAMFNKI